jgi:4-diphosphocytidyl-2-C-methyl-D-erythritol kinase
MFWAMKNDLYNPAIKLLPKIQENINALNSVGALKAMMTGSGSAVFGIFKDRKSLNDAYKKLLPKFGERLIKTKTI